MGKKGIDFHLTYLCFWYTSIHLSWQKTPLNSIKCTHAVNNCEMHILTHSTRKNELKEKYVLHLYDWKSRCTCLGESEWKVSAVKVQAEKMG